MSKKNNSRHAPSLFVCRIAHHVVLFVARFSFFDIWPQGMKTHAFLGSRPAQVPTLVHKTHIFLLLAAACRVFPTNNI